MEFKGRDLKIILASLESFKAKTKRMRRNEVEANSIGLQSSNFKELDERVNELALMIEEKIENAR